MKHYVSKEIAKKLENIGFPIDKEKSKGFWTINANGDKYYIPSNGKEYIVTPEMYEVQDWFIDKDIILTVDYAQYVKKYIFYIHVNEEDIASRYKNTYYEALEAGILKAIEIYEHNRRT